MTTITTQLADALRALEGALSPLNSGGLYLEDHEAAELTQNAREALAAYDAFSVATDPDTGARTHRAALMNEEGIVHVSGSEAAVKRCIELGRFERKPDAQHSPPHIGKGAGAPMIPASAPNHTPEPWQAIGEFIGTCEDDYQTIAYAADHRNRKMRPLEQRKADARRIVACVNACAGIPTDKLERCVAFTDCAGETKFIMLPRKA